MREKNAFVEVLATFPLEEILRQYGDAIVLQGYKELESLYQFLLEVDKKPEEYRELIEYWLSLTNPKEGSFLDSLRKRLVKG